MDFATCRRPLVGLAAEETVKLVEARASWPAIGGAGRADFPGRGLMALAEGPGAVAVEAQHCASGATLLGRCPVCPGNAVAVSVIDPMLHMW